MTNHPNDIQAYEMCAGLADCVSYTASMYGEDDKRVKDLRREVRRQMPYLFAMVLTTCNRENILAITRYQKWGRPLDELVAIAETWIGVTARARTEPAPELTTPTPYAAA